jgi:hypothetical protein
MNMLPPEARNSIPSLALNKFELPYKVIDL